MWLSCLFVSAVTVRPSFAPHVSLPHLLQTFWEEENKHTFLAVAYWPRVGGCPLPCSDVSRTWFWHRKFSNLWSWWWKYQSSTTSSNCSNIVSHCHHTHTHVLKLMTFQVSAWYLNHAWTDLFLHVRHLDRRFVPQLVRQTQLHLHALMHQVLQGGHGLTGPLCNKQTSPPLLWFLGLLNACFTHFTLAYRRLPGRSAWTLYCRTRWQMLSTASVRRVSLQVEGGGLLHNIKGIY